MKAIVLIGVLALAGCASATKTVADLQVAAAATPAITTDLNAACTSLQAILGLPKALGATGKIATGVANANAVVAKDCAKANTFITNAAPIINEVNTVAAVLLGMGVDL